MNAILVGVNINNDYEFDYSIQELENLVKAEVKRLSLELSQYKRPTNIDVTFEPLPRTGISKISRKAITANK